MKTITLDTLTLRNFKGCRELTLRFGGRNASIYGDNGTGKTTVADAWFWLLTGRDSKGDADFSVKPVDGDGHIADHAARSTVEAVLDIDGEMLTLRRELYELWSRKRGRSEATYDGNSTDFYINDVPKGKRAYEEAIAALVPLDRLRLLSDTAAFAALPWKQRREILFDLAGMPEDAALLKTLDGYEPLRDALAGKTLDELRDVLKARRKKVNARLTALPLLISENRAIEENLGAVNFDALRASVTDLEEEDHRLTAALAAAEQGDTGELRNRAEALRLELAALEQENGRYRLDQQTAAPDRERLQREIALLEHEDGTALDRYKRASRRYHAYDEQLSEAQDCAEKYRIRWKAVNAERWTGAGTCPTCGQAYPPEKAEELRRAWKADRAERIGEVKQLGVATAQRVVNLAGEVEAEQKVMIAAESAHAEAQDKLRAAHAALEALRAPKITDMPDYQTRKNGLERRAAAARDELREAERSQRSRLDSLRGERYDVRRRLEDARKQLAKEDTLNSVRARIAELEEERKTAAGELAELDHLTDLAGSFIRWKSDFLTERVNAQFRLARFRLFGEQINGATPPACDILCGGVAFDDGLNSGARINTGLDIIRTLGRFYGVTVPVFVDNAESVTRIEPIGAQVIRLAVSEKDKKLRFVEE